jgi:DNA ligase-1
MFLSMLYKRTATGAVQTWVIEVEGDSWRTISGQHGGAMVTSTWHKCFAKNTGKKNATTNEEQAVIEAKAKHKKRLELDYFESMDDIDNDIYFKPMLAAKYKDRVKKLDFKKQVWTQPKLDGMRCIVTMSGMYSRAGEQVVSSPHIHEYMLQNGFWDQDESLVYDGELYNHEFHENFNELMSIARQTKPTAEDLSKSKNLLQYHIYDITGEKEETFNERFVSKPHQNSTCGTIQFVQTDEVNSLEQIDAMYEKYLELNYEGQMVRVNDLYHNKRCNTLLKRKEFIDEEYKILDIVEGNGNRAGMAGRITLQKEDKRTFGAGIKGSHEYCKKLLLEKDKYLNNNSEATIRYFKLTPDGIPRFPVAVYLYENGRKE